MSIDILIDRTVINVDDLTSYSQPKLPRRHAHITSRLQDISMSNLNAEHTEVLGQSH